MSFDNDQLYTVTLGEGDNEPHAGDFDSTTIIDLSNYGAAQPTLTFSSGMSSSNISISGGGSGGSWGNITTSSGIFSINTDSEFHNEIIISDGEDRIKLLATLRQWSEWLGMPVVYTTDSSVLKSDMLATILQEWQQHLENGDQESARRCSDQFQTMKRLIGKANNDQQGN